jgi:hypothetical protein
MTESEWHNASEPHAMLEFLQSSGKPNERKLRLFAVACSRRMWDWIDALGRAAVDAAEDFAVGLASSDELRAARLACQGAGGQAAWYAAATNPSIAARNAARSAQAGAANNVQLGSEADELLAQADLLRDMFGNPFRPFSVDPSWLTPGVINLAQAIDDDRSFERMPELFVELEKAGCTNEEIVGHCRGRGPHVRGCWVIDLVLGKQRMP